ncbi:MAG: dephospho-CoA kinase [Chloroflexota bacterium]
MVAANKKTIIGLTGNIATGKSVVRKIFEHLGAYTIDADSLTHRVMAKDGPAYQPIIDLFGKFVLTENGEVDRAKLGKLVFSDQSALESLEEIIHPLVRQAADYLIKHATQSVIVIEAIKLQTSPLVSYCDTVWITMSTEENQLKRLTEKRKMSVEDARQRIAAQSPQAEKAALSDLKIKNDGTIEDVWKQVQAGWELWFPDNPIPAYGQPATAKVSTAPAAASPALATAEMRAERARPNMAQAIADLINKLSPGSEQLSRIDIMTTFGEKAYMLLLAEEQLVGVVGWQIENLIAQIDEFWLEVGVNIPNSITLLVEAIEVAARQLQAEAALAFVPKSLASESNTWNDLGFKPRSVEHLTVNAWREAAEQNLTDNADLLFKQLRIDRVLRPL